MSKQIIATYANRNAAQRAVEGLFRNGASIADISVLMTDETCGREFQIETGNKTTAGIGTGAAAGGAIGALIAGLTAVGAVATGGTLLAAGPLVAALAGAGAGSVAGGLLGGLVGMGIPEHEAKLSATDVESGSILIGANIQDDLVETTKDIFRTTGAEKISVQ